MLWHLTCVYLGWWLCTVLVLHEDVTERLLQPLVHVSKSHDLLGVGGGEWQKRLFPKRKGFLVACDKQDAVSEGRDDIAVNLQMQIKCQTLDRSALSYFLRRWNCLTGQSSSKSFWLTSRGTRRNLLFDMNSSIICFFIPLAWRKQKKSKMLDARLMQLLQCRDNSDSEKKAGLVSAALQFPATRTYLYNVSRLVSVLFEDEHGWSIGVNIELFLQIGRLWQSLVHVAKLQVVLISKGCQLQR